MRHSHDNEHEDTPGLIRRLRGISGINFAIGGVELVTGLLAGSATLAMDGGHNLVDGVQYRAKAKAVKESDPTRKRKLRRWGALALIGTAAIISSVEVANHLAYEDSGPDPIALPIAVAAIAANSAAGVMAHGKRHNKESKDMMRHVFINDLPASMITLVAVPLSFRFPEADLVGAGLHVALAAAAGGLTLRETRPDHHHDD